MPDTLGSNAQFFAHAGHAELSAGSTRNEDRPRVQRPTHHAPAGHPIPLASQLRYDQLLDYIARRPSGAILEIGVARAANTLRMLAFADWLGGRPRYTGIDLFGLLTDDLFEHSFCSAAKRPLSLEATRSALRHMLGDLIASRITLFEGFSHEVLPRLIDAGQKYHLIFIDGGHSVEDVGRDWQLSQKLLQRGGVIVFDDYPNWGVRPTVEAIDPTMWTVRVLPHRDTFRNHRLDDDPAMFRHHQLVEVRRRDDIENPGK